MIDREDVIRMTEKAMQSDFLMVGGMYFTLEVSDIARLIAAAKAEEREACVSAVWACPGMGLNDQRKAIAAIRARKDNI